MLGAHQRPASGRRWATDVRKRVQRLFLTWCPGVESRPSRIWNVVGLIGCLYLLVTVLHFFWSSLSLRGGAGRAAGGGVATLQPFALDDLCSPPIDIVYTWVNGSDARLQRLLAEHKTAACEAARGEDGAETGDDGCRSDMVSASRYVDNEELRFSLRSVEKFAPWVRHIYVVTNGQVPHWLRIDHPRLSVVTHEQIFANQSHLPTFSSPAIEVHLHKIPGLSDQFIYLNDDVMFGGPVFPDDFVTHAGGQNVFLSWAVPNCNEGCPANWIGDGYCDIACNVSACEWDGGDCRNSSRASYGGSYTPPAGSAGSGSDNRWWNNYASGSSSSWADRLSRYCTPGCPDSWIGDKYCDRACENEACGFDGGDCGVDVIADGMAGAALTVEHNHTALALPPGAAAYYFNFTAFVGDSRILDGSHDNSELVRTATVSQKNKLMIMTFHRNVTAQNVSVLITYEAADDPARSVDFVFVFELSTVVAAPALNDTAAPPADQALPTSNDDDQADNDEGTVADDAAPSTGRNLLGLDFFDFRAKLAGAPPPTEQQADWLAAKKQQQLALVDDAAQYQESAVHAHPISKWERLVANSDEERRMGGGRRLLDVFGDSLKHVDRLYNRAYGQSARKVPAHMPHFINKHIMAELQSIWPEQYEETSSHRVRAGNDMQMAFAYFYHMIHYPRDFNIDDIFAYLLDADADGQLNENELRTLAVYLYGTPLDAGKFAALEQTLRSPPGDQATAANEATAADQATAAEEARPAVAVAAAITVDMLKQHAGVLDSFKSVWRKLPKYRTTIQNTDEVAFVMVPTNETQAKKSFDGIRSRRQRFICLNDNMNHSDPHSESVVAALREFYMSLVPLPSEFELPPASFHPEGLYIDELMAVRAHNYLVTNALVAVLLVLTIVIVCLVARKRQRKNRLRRDRSSLQII